MSRFMRSRFHSAPVRAEMRALRLSERRMPVGTMVMSAIAGANAASVVGMLMCL